MNLKPLSRLGGQSLPRKRLDRDQKTVFDPQVLYDNGLHYPEAFQLFFDILSKGIYESVPDSKTAIRTDRGKRE